MKRIQYYLYDLKEIVKKFYIIDKVSDDTIIGTRPWSQLKHEVCSGNEFEEQSWFQNFNKEEIDLLYALKKIQNDIGIDFSISPQINPV